MQNLNLIKIFIYQLKNSWSYKANRKDNNHKIFLHLTEGKMFDLYEKKAIIKVLQNNSFRICFNCVLHHYQFSHSWTQYLPECSGKTTQDNTIWIDKNAVFMHWLGPN